jgi:tetrahydrodipicolinate N-succinyltransferase
MPSAGLGVNSSVGELVDVGVSSGIDVGVLVGSGVSVGTGAGTTEQPINMLTTSKTVKNFVFIFFS